MFSDQRQSEASWRKWDLNKEYELFVSADHLQKNIPYIPCGGWKHEQTHGVGGCMKSEVCYLWNKVLILDNCGRLFCISRIYEVCVYNQGESILVSSKKQEKKRWLGVRSYR